MAPRPYRLGRRQEATEQTRANVLAAARALLTAPEGFSGFTVDAVAREAGVARMTVYYQFESKIGLLEALLDSLSIVQGAGRIREAMSQAEPLASLDGLIEAFTGFWSEDRVIQRRLQALAELDPDFDQVITNRAGRMAQATRVLAERIARRHGTPSADDVPATAERLAGLLSFRSVDALAGERLTPSEVAPLVQRLARTILGLPADARP